jgi:HEAT repeat protein
LDSTIIRETLRKRLTDSFREVRDEAIWGLALRRDPVALRLLLERLNSEERVASDETTAAEVLGVDYNTPLDTLRAGLRDLVRD